MARKTALNKVKDWPLLANREKYQAKRVALRVGVTLRRLEQYFRKRFKKTPLEQFTLWIAETADRQVLSVHNADSRIAPGAVKPREPPRHSRGLSHSSSWGREFRSEERRVGKEG